MIYLTADGHTYVNLKMIPIITLDPPYIQGEFRSGEIGKQRMVRIFAGKSPNEATLEMNRILTNMHHDVDPKVREKFAVKSTEIVAEDENFVEDEIQPGANPQGQREIEPRKMSAYTLRVIDGKKWKEVSTILEVSESSVRNWVREVQEILSVVPPSEEASLEDSDEEASPATEEASPATEEASPATGDGDGDGDDDVDPIETVDAGEGLAHTVSEEAESGDSR